MNEKRNSREVEIDGLAKNLARLVEIFRKGGPASDINWWGKEDPQSIFNPSYGYQTGQPLFEKVAQGILKLNPEMLSKREIEIKITYEFLQNQTISVTQPEHLSNQSLVDEAKNHLNKLIEFEAWQDIDIPIGNLWLTGKPVKLGYVTFMAITEQELVEWKKDPTPWPKKPDVHVFARVNAPGDLEKAVSYTRNQVNIALNILRAICFPFGRGSEHWKVGFIGDYIFPGSTPIRINGKAGSYLLPPSTISLELRADILRHLQASQWELIKKLILKAESSRNSMENKLLDGIHWLGESIKPDTNNSKFVKISFALETLIGGEPKAEDLKVRGITAMLAERAAFIAGKDLDDRKAIDKGIRDNYKIRSNIVHGGRKGASLDDIDNFGRLVRRLALALLEMLAELGDAIPNVEELEKWVKRQRYTLPTNNRKE